MSLLVITYPPAGVRVIFGPGFSGVDGCVFQCTYEPWYGGPMFRAPRLDNRGPARTPPVKRHFWERPRR